MNKILVIGTGYGQLPLIKKCKEMGIYTIGIDSNHKSPGATLVDKFENIDLINLNGALKIAKKHKINGTATLQSDIGVPTIGYLNSKMFLNGISYRTALVCSHKDLFRNKLKKYKIKQPKFKIVKNYNNALSAIKKISLPCIIKPVDASGSKGVAKLNNTKNLKSYINNALKFSKSGKLIIEQFIDGLELGAQTFSLKNKTTKIFFHNDQLSSNGYFVPVGHSYPVRNKKLLEKYHKQIIDTLKVLEIKEGPANFDLIINKRGEMFIIEVGARVGATCLPELTTRHTGLDWVKLVVESCLGKLNFFPDLRLNACAAKIIESPKDGKFYKFKLNQDLRVFSQYNPEIEITSKKGDNVSILRKGTDRIGKVIVSAKSLSEAEKVCNEILSKIEIIVK